MNVINDISNLSTPACFEFLTYDVRRVYATGIAMYNQRLIRYFEDSIEEYENALQDRKGTQASTRYHLSAILESLLKSITSTKVICKRQKGGSSFVTQFPDYNTSVCYGKAKPSLAGFIPRSLAQPMLFKNMGPLPNIVCGNWHLGPDLTIVKFLFVDSESKFHEQLDLSMINIDAIETTEYKKDIKLNWKERPKDNQDKEAI